MFALEEFESSLVFQSNLDGICFGVFVYSRLSESVSRE